MSVDLSFIDDTGTVRHLGNRPASLRYAWTPYGSVPECPLIDPTEYPERVREIEASWPGDEYPHLPYVHDQAAVSQCNASATAAAMEFCRHQLGLPPLKLSAADLYHRINGGMDRGSTLEDGIVEAFNGVGTVEQCGYLWGRGFRPASKEERAANRVLEAYLCPTFDHCFSATLMGFALISGVRWFPNYTPGPDGWLPAGRGRWGGHALFGFKPTMKDRRKGIWHQNSWRPSWGIRGRCVIPEEGFGGPVGGWWAVRLVTSEVINVPQPV